MATDPWLPSLFGERRGVLDPFQALRKQMDDVFSDWAGGLRQVGFPFAGGEGFSPRVDVSETDKALTVVAELPGVEQKDVEVSLSGHYLTIKGEKRQEREEKSDDKDKAGATYHRIERSFGLFQRSIAIPFEADPTKVAAEFKSGTLTIVVPKPAEAATASRRIEIKAGG